MENSTRSRPVLSDGEGYATVSSMPPKRRAGRTKFRETRHPVYKGVRQRGNGSNRWVCEVREPNKKSRIWLGTFPTAEMAARAHDVAALALRGRSACLNFADSATVLNVPCSTSPRDIQRAAAQAAEAFRPTKLSDGDDVMPDQLDSTESEKVGNNDYRRRFAVEEEDLIEFGNGYFDMAEGLLIDPPPQPAAPIMFDNEEDSDSTDVMLWSYSI